MVMDANTSAWTLALEAGAVDDLWSLWCELVCMALDVEDTTRGNPVCIIEKKSRKRPPPELQAEAVAQMVATRLHQLAKLKMMAARGKPQEQQERALIRALRRSGAVSPKGITPEEAEAPELQAWARSLQWEVRKKAGEMAKVRRQKQSDQLRAMADGCTGQVHKWLKGDPNPPMLGCITDDGTWTTRPDKVLAKVLDDWESLWLPANPNLGKDLYKAKWWPKAHPPWEVPPITGAALKAACMTTATNSASGPDNWSVETLKMLPLAAWDALACILVGLSSG